MASTALEDIPNITKLSDRVTRVLGQNPGKFTLQGTNTYLIGSSNPYILIDTAEGLPSYLPVLQSALSSTLTHPALPDVSDIVLSHWHHDHVGGLSSVLSLLQEVWEARNPGQKYVGPRLHKFPLPKEKLSEVEARWNRLPKLLSEIPRELYTPRENGEALHDLSDGQIIHTSGASLEFLHTPGHTLDSISFYIPEDQALFTADTVLGQGTSVFEDLRLYLSSLNRMLSFLDSQTSREEGTLLYPSHGPVIPKTRGRDTIKTYIEHRLEREAQVVHLLSILPPNGEAAWSTWDIVKTLYAKYPENLWEPAMRGIELHLKKLTEEGRVRKVGDGEGKEARWSLVSKPPSPSL